MPRLTVTQDTVFKKSTAQSISLPETEKFNVNAGKSFEVNYAFRVGQHCWVKLQKALGKVGKVGYFFLPHVHVQIEEIRAVWLTHVDSNILSSRTAIQQGLQQLKELGFNTIYPVVWQRGCTLYPSSVAEAFIGCATVSDRHFSNRDMLAEIVETAKAYSLRVIPWFEYGLATLPGSLLEKRHPDWITLNQKGEKIRIKTTDGKPDHFVWLNPCHPEAQQFIVNLITEVVTKYDVDGIQLDDHFCFPVELGYDSFTADLYQAEQGKLLPQNPHHSERLKWTSQKMTDLLTQVFKTVKTQRSDCFISISPNPLAFAKNNYSTDWNTWIKQGLVEELVLQVYRDNLPSFTRELDKPEVRAGRDRIPTVIGVLTGLRTKPVSINLLEQQIKTVRQKNFAGISCFFYETIFNETLSSTKTVRSQSDLQRLFPKQDQGDR